MLSGSAKAEEWHEIGRGDTRSALVTKVNDLRPIEVDRPDMVIGRHTEADWALDAADALANELDDEDLCALVRAERSAP